MIKLKIYIKKRKKKKKKRKKRVQDGKKG